MPMVNYYFGSEEQYSNLSPKDAMSFYKTENNLYLGEKKLTNDADIQQLKQLLGDLSSLDTTEKRNIVDALNEVLESQGMEITIL